MRWLRRRSRAGLTRSAKPDVIDNQRATLGRPLALSNSRISRRGGRRQGAGPWAWCSGADAPHAVRRNAPEEDVPRAEPPNGRHLCHRRRRKALNGVTDAFPGPPMSARVSRAPKEANLGAPSLGTLRRRGKGSHIHTRAQIWKLRHYRNAHGLCRTIIHFRCRAATGLRRGGCRVATGALPARCRACAGWRPGSCRAGTGSLSAGLAQSFPRRG